MREVTIALAQMTPVLNDNEENLRRMGSFIQRICSEQPTDLIVFPELALSGYECGLNFTRLAERVTGHAVSYIAGKAAEFSVYIVFGMPVKEKVESILFNAAVRHRAGRRAVGRLPQAAPAGRGAPGVPARLSHADLRHRVRWARRDDRLGPGLPRGRARPRAGRRGPDRRAVGLDERPDGGVARVHGGPGVRERGVPGRGEPGGPGAELHLRRRVDARRAARAAAHVPGRARSRATPSRRWTWTRSARCARSRRSSSAASRRRTGPWCESTDHARAVGFAATKWRTRRPACYNPPYPREDFSYHAHHRSAKRHVHQAHARHAPGHGQRRGGRRRLGRRPDRPLPRGKGGGSAWARKPVCSLPPARRATWSAC